jgi:U6 snRNA-associated Sm-like protein LSm4
MLPLGLLNAAQASPILVELKNGKSKKVNLDVGETFNGHMVNCDNWMNINLKNVICTSPDGSKFWSIPEIYIRGNTIKYLRISDDIVDKAKKEQDIKVQERKNYPSQKNSGGGQKNFKSNNSSGPGGKSSSTRGGRQTRGKPKQN